MTNKTTVGHSAIITVVKRYLRTRLASVFFLFILFGFGNLVSAQDLLILKSGEEIKAIIIEEGTDIIRFRDFEDPAGPLYLIKKDKVDTIKYKKVSKNEIKDQTGKQVRAEPAEEEIPVQSYDLQTLESKKRIVMLNGQKLSVRKVKTLMEDYPDALESYESGRTMCIVSNSCVVSVVFICPVISGIANHKENDSDKKAVATKGLAITGSLFLTGIVLSSVGKNKIRKSVTLYNSAIRKPVSWRLNFGVQENGIGLALRF